MNIIDQELIPNKNILSFEYWDNMECETYLLSVTRGMAAVKHKQTCYNQLIDELSSNEISLNDNFFEKNNSYELWLGKDLIGLCDNSVNIQDWMGRAKSLEREPDSRERKTLFLMGNLNAVFILKAYRGKEIGAYFANTIGDIQIKTMFGFLAHNTDNKIKEVNAIFYCDYETDEGEAFHSYLLADDISPYSQKILNKLGYSYNVDISSSY